MIRKYAGERPCLPPSLLLDATTAAVAAIDAITAATLAPAEGVGHLSELLAEAALAQPPLVSHKLRPIAASRIECIRVSHHSTT